MLLTWANICCVLQSRKPYKHLHSGSCWENKKLLRHFKPTITFQFRHMSFLSYSLSEKTLYSFTVLPSSSCTCVLSRELSALSYVTWCIFHSDTFPQFIPPPFSVIQYTTFLYRFAVPHPGQRRVTLLVIFIFNYIVSTILTCSTSSVPVHNDGFMENMNRIE